MSLFDELKRRNVFRVAAAYVILSWVLLQVGDVLFDTLELPSVWGKGLFALLVLGFIPALFFSWAYELTPDGLKRESEVRSDPAVNAQTGQRLNIATIAMVLIGVGFAIVNHAWLQPTAQERPAAERSDSGPATTAPSDASIAVLPFEDLSPEGNQAYFSDGIAEEILNVLAGVDGLAVASRTSSFQFKGQRAIGIPTIADTLDVRNVLEGSVRTAGDQIRVTAQLIDATNDQHLWSETFDRELSTENVFAIQDEIARSIVAAIRDQLGVELEAPVAVAAITESVDAYALYLRARSLFRARSDFREVDLLLSRAIELDPDFDDALAMRAATLTIAPEYGVFLYGDAETSSLMSLELAERALAIDPDNALAVGVLGLREDFLLYREGDTVALPDVVRRYDEALALDPDSLNLLNWRGHTFLRMGYFDRAEQDFAHCLEVEPAMVPCRNNRVAAILLSGRAEEADRAFSEALRFGTIGADMSTLMMVHQLGREDAFYMQALRQPPLRGWLDMGELHEALESPGADHSVLRQRLRAHAEALGTEYALADILIALGDYDLTSFTYAFWFAPYTDYRRSQGFKRFAREFGMLDYWREHGFPDRCRPIAVTDGEDDFECE
ncbi:MAG: hypothetical protein R3323_06925 [Wenzhouxiangellaceae bacterium]|nr:hypothetical protein [Wenzhouxiangellaceae bacterium]